MLHIHMYTAVRSPGTRGDVRATSLRYVAQPFRFEVSVLLKNNLAPTFPNQCFRVEI